MIFVICLSKFYSGYFLLKSYMQKLLYHTITAKTDKVYNTSEFPLRTHSFSLYPHESAEHHC